MFIEATIKKIIFMPRFINPPMEMIILGYMKEQNSLFI